MRTKLIVANWKMNTTLASAEATAQTVIRNVEARTTADVVLCPPYIYLPKVREVVRDSYLKLGAQDVFWMEQGAFTGKISAKMLYDVGVSYCIVGHSETRGRFGSLEVAEQDLSFFSEVDRTINLKVKGLIYHSISPVLCVGETGAERTGGKTDEVIDTQLKGALEGLDASELYFFSIAYEPVWAIGTGQTCDAAEANRVCGLIRARLAALFDGDVAQEIRILYGGSVKSSNSGELFAQPEIDGGLVGGASLDPMEFSRIVMSA